MKLPFPLIYSIIKRKLITNTQGAKILTQETIYSPQSLGMILWIIVMVLGLFFIININLKE